MKQRVTILFISIFCFQFGSLFAQNSETKKIKGQVIGNQKSIEFASVTLFSAKDASALKSTKTDADGRFVFEINQAGTFYVSVQFVGYANFKSEPFEISTEEVLELKPIALTESAQQLNAVTVSSKKPFIEQKADKTVVNVDASPTNTGLSALEVLEKSPGVSVDKDGNVSLKGKQGVLILVDGKQTYLSGPDLANMLRNLSSSNLDQIELMTNPPAKYDASGNSGIINIKTKKLKIKGFNTSITVGGGMGNHPKANESLNLNYRTGKVNLFGNYSYNYNKGSQDLDLNRNFRNQQTQAIESIFGQQSDIVNKSQTHNFKLGADFYASKKTTLGVVINGYFNPADFSSLNTTNIYNQNYQLQTVTLATGSSKENWKNLGGNFNFKHSFDTTGTELTADADIIHYSSDLSQLFTNEFFNNGGGKIQQDEILRGILPGSINIYSAKTDFTHPLKGNAKLEAGLKSSYVKTDNNANYDNLINGNWQTDTGRSNHFIYKENINAAYVNVSEEFSKKWTAQVGLRLENTSSNGNQLTTGETFKRNYTQLFPTSYLQYSLNDKNQFTLSYGRRIERPDYGDLNPFYYFLDKYTYQVGNPYLQPQFSHNIELSHSFKGFLNTSFSYSTTNNIIQDVIQQVDSTHTSYLKKSNIAKQNSFTLSMNAGFAVTKWWRTNIYAQAQHNQYKGFVNNGNINISGAGFMTNISNQFTLKKGWNLEASGFYRSKMVEGTIVSEPMGVINFAVAKNMLKNKGTLKLNLRDPFDIQMFRGYSKYQNVDVTVKNQWDNRVVNLSFTYRFSKGKAAASNHRSSAEDEQNRVKGRN